MNLLPDLSWSDINEGYQADPLRFAKEFFDSIMTLDPKFVRMVGYNLWLRGLTFANLSAGADLKFLQTLDQVPRETMLVLLKYKFPMFIDGQPYFINSLNRRDLSWLPFHLELFNYTGQSLGTEPIQLLIEQDNLNGVEMLLYYNSELPRIEEIIPSDDMIKLLLRYGADIPNVSEEIRTAAAMIPPYRWESGNRNTYFEMDNVEEMDMVLGVDSTILDDGNFLDLHPNLSLKRIETLLTQKKQSVYVDENIIVPWPYYTKMKRTNWRLQTEMVETIAAAPPDVTEVYERLAVQSTAQDTPMLPQDPIDRLPYNAIFEPSPGTVVDGTFPIPETTIVPTAHPPLPGLPKWLIETSTDTSTDTSVDTVLSTDTIVSLPSMAYPVTFSPTLLPMSA